nr:MAG TPA: hypothetical protein [Caudoviricetes sp.]
MSKMKILVLLHVPTNRTLVAMLYHRKFSCILLGIYCL